MKDSRGITLIALIITIVVMIILASVSVVGVINGGLIQSSIEAKEQVENQITTQEQWTQNIIDEF